MDKSNKLDKLALLKGVHYRKEIELPELGGNILIRPLNDAETIEMQSIIMSGVPKEIVDKIREEGANPEDAVSDSAVLVDMFRNTAKANYFVCSVGIVNEDGSPMFTKEEVGQFIPGLPAKIADEIRGISGTNMEVAAAQVESFRQE